MNPKGLIGPHWAIGLMSGTSVDGVDGVLARFEGQGTETRIQTLAQASRPMPAALRRELLALQQPGPDELARAAEATRELTDLYAEVAIELLHRALDSALTPESMASVVVGAHGQTVRHRPELGYTLQLIDGARLAERCGLAVVTNFRSADVAAGGQGAPLVPAFHALAFSSRHHPRAIVNIGGIANVSLLPVSDQAPAHHDPRNHTLDRARDFADAWTLEKVTGFDTGPGNLLMDAWCEQHTGQPFDRGGQWAATGRVDEALLARLLSEPYFAQPAPKSTGRDLFTVDWLAKALESASLTSVSLTAPYLSASGASAHKPEAHKVAPEHVQATLLELTALLIAKACREYGAKECYVCGGGAFNHQLMKRLSALMPGAKVDTTTALGMPPDAVEALAFAWLGRQRMVEMPANLPAVTGARGPRILGAVYPAPP